jgi:hypothetical protein
MVTLTSSNALPFVFRLKKQRIIIGKKKKKTSNTLYVQSLTSLYFKTQ